jgi:hypothetical protein
MSLLDANNLYNIISLLDAKDLFNPTSFELATGL